MNVKNEMKRLYAIVVLLALTMTAAMAQDLIVKQDGETIKAYRTDVGNNAIYYRLEDNDDAAILSIPKVNVLFVKMQDGTKIVIDGVESKVINAENNVVPNGYVPHFPIEPVADPKAIAKAEIGSLIEFYDGTKGVVFYLDGKGHGLAVYLSENINDKKQWQVVRSWHECVDINEIPNTYGKSDMLVPGLGSYYCDVAIQQLGVEELPAIQWCRSIGTGWYLPSIGELYQLIMVANEGKGRSGLVSKALKRFDGYPLNSGHCYLSSSESDNTDVLSIYKNNIEFANKYYTFHCRAIRAF